MTAVPLVTSSAAGLLLGRRAPYTPDPATLPTFLGQGALTLAVGPPQLVVSQRGAVRGSLRGLRGQTR